MSDNRVSNACTSGNDLYAYDPIPVYTLTFSDGTMHGTNIEMRAQGKLELSCPYCLCGIWFHMQMKTIVVSKERNSAHLRCSSLNIASNGTGIDHKIWCPHCNKDITFA